MCVRPYKGTHNHMQTYIHIYKYTEGEYITFDFMNNEASASAQPSNTANIQNVVTAVLLNTACHKEVAGRTCDIHITHTHKPNRKKNSCTPQRKCNGTRQLIHVWLVWTAKWAGLSALVSMPRVAYAIVLCRGVYSHQTHFVFGGAQLWNRCSMNFDNSTSMQINMNDALAPHHIYNVNDWLFPRRIQHTHTHFHVVRGVTLWFLYCVVAGVLLAPRILIE